MAKIQLTPASILASVPKQLFEEDGIGVRIDSRREVTVSCVNDPDLFLTLEDGEDSGSDISMTEGEVKIFEKLTGLLKEFNALGSGITFEINAEGISIIDANGEVNIPVDVALQIRGEFLGYLKKNIGYTKASKDAASNDSTTTVATPAIEAVADDSDDEEYVDGLDEPEVA